MAKVASRSGYESREIEIIGDITYVGSSSIGEAESSDKWVIKKIEVIGGETSIKFVEGAWADRLTLSYI